MKRNRYMNVGGLVLVFLFALAAVSCGGSGGGNQPTQQKTANPRNAEVNIEGLDNNETVDLVFTTNGKTVRLATGDKTAVFDDIPRNSMVKMRIENPPEGKVCFFSRKASVEQHMYVGLANVQDIRVKCMKKLPPPRVSLDPTLTPPTFSQPLSREIGVLKFGDSQAIDVIVGEFLVAAKDQSIAQNIADRWKGSLAGEVDLMRFDGLERNIYVLKIDLASIDIATIDLQDLAKKLQEYSPVATGDITVSSEDLIKALYVVASETNDEVTVIFNQLLKGAEGIATDGYVMESSSGPVAAGYSPNAFEWEYMRPGGELDINVVGAWALLENAGLLERNVNISVFDGGFRSNPAISDYPPGISLNIANEDRRNAMGCGASRSDCFWHGATVAAILAADGDNRRGIVGPAAFVVNRYRLIGWGFSGGVVGSTLDFFEYIGNILYEIVRAANPLDKLHILNFSGAYDAPAVLGSAISLITDPLFIYMRVAGVLPFAAAGNGDSRGRGINVDAIDCVPLIETPCWEETVWIPCESSGVICVGGTLWNRDSLPAGRIAVHPSSNYGTDDASTYSGTNLLEDIIGLVFLQMPGIDSVDIYAPYTYYVPNINSNGNLSSPAVVQSSGTSFSTPFVAGIAANTWQGIIGSNIITEYLATNLGLADDLVIGMMLAGARDVVDRPDSYPGPAFTGRPLVNAFGPLAQALYAIGGDPYQIVVKITEPSDNEDVLMNYPVRLSGDATIDLRTGQKPELTWRSSIDGRLGNEPTLLTTNLSPGEHTITLEARNSAGDTYTDSITLNIINVPPMVEILNPSDTGRVTLCTGENALFSAVVHDPNQLREFSFPNENVEWWNVDPIFGYVATGKSIMDSLLYDIVGVTAYDDTGESGSASMLVTRESCTDNPPTITITNPLNESFIYTGGTTLTATATDPEDGDLSATVEWYVNNRLMGVGSSLTVDLPISDQPYRIKAKVMDSGRNLREHTIEVVSTVGLI